MLHTGNYLRKTLNKMVKKKHNKECRYYITNEIRPFDKRLNKLGFFIIGPKCLQGAFYLAVRSERNNPLRKPDDIVFRCIYGILRTFVFKRLENKLKFIYTSIFFLET